MKFKNVCYLFIATMVIVSCSRDNIRTTNDLNSLKNLKDNNSLNSSSWENSTHGEQENNISEIITTFDSTFKYMVENDVTDSTAISNYVTNKMDELGILVSFDTLDIQEFTPSDAYHDFRDRLSSSNLHNTAEDYLSSLSVIENDVSNSNDLSTFEEELLLQSINFLQAFVNWGIEINEDYPVSTNGWWDRLKEEIKEAIDYGIEGCSWGATIGGAVGSLGGAAGTIAGTIGGCREGFMVGSLIGMFPG